MRRIAALLAVTAAIVGTGSPASAAAPEVVAEGLRAPADVAPLDDGSVLIADAGDHRVRRVAPDGRITTVAGSGVAGLSGDGGPATAARLNGPRSIAPLPDGGFLVADSANGLVRRVDDDGTIESIAGGGLFASRCSPDMLRLGRVRAVTAAADGGYAFVADAGIFSVDRQGGVRLLATSADVQDIDAADDGRFLLAGGRDHVVYALERDGSRISVLAGRTSDPEDDESTRPRFDDVTSVTGYRNLNRRGALVVERDGDRVREVNGTAIIDWSSSREHDLEAPTAVSVDPRGGVLVADAREGNVVRWDAPDWRPVSRLAAMAPGQEPTACRGLDRSFGRGGVTVFPGLFSVHLTYLPSENGLVVDDQGRAAVTARAHRDGRSGLGVARTTADGRADPAFGVDGLGFAPLPDGVPITPRGLLRLPDGRLVAAASAGLAGSSDWRMVLAGFLPDGRLDPAFGAGGILTLFEDESATGGILLPGPAGTITVLAAVAHDQWRVFRVDARGRPVGGFGTDGVVAVEESGGLGAAAVDPQGRLIVPAGYGRLRRLAPDGTLDRTFGERGAAQLPESSPLLVVHSVTLQPDGRIVVAGRRNAGGSIDGFVARLRTDGSLDPSFGEGGWRIVENTGEFRDVVVQRDGGLLLAGYGFGADLNGPLLLALRPDGSTDPTFGIDGRLVTPVDRVAFWNHVRLLPGGRVLADGALSPGGEVTLARFDVGSRAPAEPADPSGDDDEAAGEGGDAGGGEGQATGGGGTGGAGGRADVVAPAPAAPGTLPVPAAGVPSLLPRTAPSRARRVATPPRITRRTLLTRGLPLALRPSRTGRAVLVLRAGRRVVARRTLKVRTGALRRVRLRITRRAWPRRAPRTVRLTFDVAGRRLATTTVRVVR